MNTNYRQRLETLNKLENMLPAVLDMLDDVNTMPSSSQNEMNAKIKLILKVVDLKDALIDQTAIAKIALTDKQKEFMADQAGMAQDVG